ncbi:DNA polymerase III subunit alpha [Gracilibacillus caseinilyticus]|uniref:DNA polymerase III subunit alpha n=1 Tax=Gracilibacillus caseinilyticus TaxID=2932256 RepID=A0ABY4EU44_9BACI|nr:DNA polymerase III subunit alpha [Gracilibacillus caseinilyticus]UOQ47159.1 DNA polymerase III subunit alpha [Gracilibacillus caseinilyticus]
MPELTALQLKSGYSLMKSTIQIDSLVEQAKQLGYSSLAITDHQVMHGAIRFYTACKEAGIKPIIGLSFELMVENEAVQVISLAKNYHGYQQLLQLSTAIQYGENITIERMKDFQEDLLLIISAEQWSIDDIEAQVNALSRLLAPMRYYLGISENMLPYREQLQGLTIEKVAMQDIRYLTKQDAVAYSCVRAMDQGVKWNKNILDDLEGTYLPTNQELEWIYQSWPDLRSNANRVADQCAVDLPLDQRLLPKYPVPDGEHADQFLEVLCQKKLQTIYPSVTEDIKARFHYELDVIQSMGFSDYFLIVWDFVEYAKQQQIMVGPGRGSAAGSLIAYLLGITNVDPIKYELLFERFLNPERVTMPDIDIDFSDERRDEVIRYVVDKYGAEYVAQIVTFGTFAARSLLRELFKVLAIEESDQAYILKSLPKDSGQSIAAMLKQAPELTEYIKQSDPLKNLFKIANRLEGLPRHVSTHAAGVIISQDALVDHAAAMPAQNEVPLTQYAMNDLAIIGLLKMDFLGLRNLSLIEKIVKQIERQHKRRISLDDIPSDDPATFSLLQNGHTNGVFQLESQGMQQVLRELKPTEFEDVVAVNALYRPGPMEFIPAYVARKHGKEKVRYPHPDLEPILAKTYGVLVYQEQIMQIVNLMAGFSYGEADILRRAVSKKDKDALINNRSKFINGCLQKGYARQIAEQIFDWIVRFSNYGFNRSHAVAYSVIAYQLAYLKANYPVAFFIEMLSSQMGNQDKIQVYLREAKARDIRVLPPSINESIGKFKAEKQGIRIGLNLIKGVGYQAFQEIFEVRKKQRFKSLFDFCLRVPLQKVNRSIIESLILAGAFDELHDNRATMLASLDEAMEQGELFKEFDDQMRFFEGDLALDFSYTETDPFPVMHQLMMEKEVIGFFVSTHPLAEVRDKIRQIGYITIQQAIQSKQKKLKMAAVIQSLKVIRTKKGEAMAFVMLADESAEVDAVLFPVVFRQVNHWLEEDSFVFVEGRIEERNQKKQMIIDVIQPYQLDEKQFTSDKIYIKVEREQTEAMTKLSEFATKYPGASTVYLYQGDANKLFKMSANYNLDNTWNVIKELKQFFGEGNVVIRHSS